jgi:sporulation protein YlmC with PRC-barrel domain
MLLELGIPVRCDDQTVGDLADVVIEPATHRLTHVVVQTRDDEQVRLVPVELVAAGRGDQREVALTCSAEELRSFEPIREFAYLRANQFPQSDEKTDVGVEDMIAMPSYAATELGDFVGEFDESVSLTYDRIPKGEAELRRSSDVVSSDGHRLGHVEGFIVIDGSVTHVVLEHGHLWGTRDVTIPIEAVAKIETDNIALGISKDEAGALPSVRVHRFPSV